MAQLVLDFLNLVLVEVLLFQVRRGLLPRTALGRTALLWLLRWRRAHLRTGAPLSWRALKLLDRRLNSILVYRFFQSFFSMDGI